MTDDKSNKKVLLIEEIDDEASLRNALHEKLSLEGFDVLEAKNGEEGLAIALSHHPDLILLDILMPKMGGIEMLKKLRQDEWGSHVPVIILTNLDSTKTVADALEFADGFQEYLIKNNLKIEDVVARVREKLKNNI